MFLKTFFLSTFIIHSFVIAQYHYFNVLPDNGTREIAYATDSFQEHLFKSMDYTINMFTPGFIRKSVTNVRLFNTNEGRHIVIPQYDYKWIDGAPVETERMLDFCINGNNRSFFTIQLPNGVVGYTRDGRFRIDFENRLVTISGNFPVLGENGPILLDEGNEVTVSRLGGMYDGARYVDQLKITVFENFEDMNRYLHSINGTMFVLSDVIDVDEKPESYSILQGFILQSNTFKSYDSKFYSAYYSLASQTLFNLLDNQKNLFNMIGN